MKYFTLIFTILVSNNLYAAPALSGIENLQNFTGVYEVVDCTSCPDIAVGKEYNIRDLKRFYLVSHSIPQNQLPAGAGVSQSISYGEDLLPAKGGMCELNKEVGLFF